MNKEGKMAEGKRVRYANAADGYKTPDNFPKTTTELGQMKTNDLRHLRHQVQDGLDRGLVADADIRSYFNFLDKVEGALAKSERADEELKRRAAQAPAIRTNGMRDNQDSLAQRFSITRAIHAASMGHQQSGAEAELIAEGQKANPMARGIAVPAFVFKRNVYGNDSGSGSIAAAVTGRRTTSAEYLAALHDVPVAERLGATSIQASGATFLVPFLGDLIPSTAAEGAAVSSSASFNELSLTPQRYGRRVDVTTLALRTSSEQLDEIIMRSMAEGHATAIDRSAFAAVVANATYTTATAGTTANDLAASSIADIFKLAKEATQASGNSQSPNIVCSPLGFQALNTATESAITQTVAGAYRNATGAQVLQANTLQDGDLTSANVVGGSGTIAGAGVAIAGNFQDLIIANWGVDLVVDNLTNAESGIIRCISNSYSNAGVVRDSLRVMGVTATEIAAT